MGLEMTGKDETLRGGGGVTMGQPPWRHPRGGDDGTKTLAASPGGGGANTLVQPHYHTPTKRVNPAGARGGEG